MQKVTHKPIPSKMRSDALKTIPPSVVALVSGIPEAVIAGTAGLVLAAVGLVCVATGGAWG